MAGLLLVPLAAQRNRVRVAQPFFQLRLESPRLLTEGDYAPLFEGLADVLTQRLGIEGEAGAELDALWAGLAWPLEITVLLDRTTSLPIAGLWMPAEGASLLDALVPLSAGEVTERGRVECRGAEFTHVVLTAPDGSMQVRACEGLDRGRRLLVLGRVDSMGEPAAAIERFFQSSERTSPAKLVLEKHATGGDLGWVFNFRSLLSSTDRRELGAMEAVTKLVLGPRFEGLSGKMNSVDDGIAIDLFADVRPGRGWVGSVLHREPRELALAGWIPDGVTDFVALDSSVGGAVRLCRTVEGFGGEVKPGDLHHDLGWLDVELKELLDTHFTGQLIAASEAGIETQFESLEKLEGMIVGVGAFDGPRLLAEARRIVNAAEDVEAALEPTPAVGPGIHTLTWKGVPHLHLVATREAVFVSGADPASAALLRKCLAAGGRGPHPRSADGSPPDRVATMLGRGHVLRHVLWIAREGGGAGSLPDAVSSFLKGNDGVAEWRLVVDADGARLRLEL